MCELAPPFEFASLLTTRLVLIIGCMAMKTSVANISNTCRDMVDTAQDNEVRDALRILAQPAWLPQVISYVAQQAALAVPTFTLPATRSTGLKLPPPIRAFVASVS
jgi:hypothetical protein